MELEARLRAFAAFARRRSFSAAARELRISQPAVSKHIADVEREAGVKLVERRPRGGELTPAGEFLANHVLRAQALLAQAVRGVGEFRERATGLLTIVASGVPATYLLPEVVVTFQRAHPDVHVRIVPGASAQTMDALRSHRAEFGVVGGFAAAPEIEAEPLVEEDVLLVGPPELAGRRMSRRDAEAATWISAGEGSATRAVVEAAWSDSGITPSRRLELPNWEAVKLAVARGDGVAAVAGSPSRVSSGPAPSSSFSFAGGRCGGRSQSSAIERPHSRPQRANSWRCCMRGGAARRRSIDAVTAPLPDNDADEGPPLARHSPQRGATLVNVVPGRHRASVAPSTRARRVQLLLAHTPTYSGACTTSVFDRCHRREIRGLRRT
jgi:LysR family transcriptional regulator, transcriptional activator of the cysJI operon